MILAGILLLIVQTGMAQKYQRTKLGIKLMQQDMELEVQFYSPKLVRILKTPTGKALKKESISVIKKPEACKLKIIEQAGLLNVGTEALNVRINLKSGVVSFLKPEDKPLLTEKESGTTFKPVMDVKEKTYKVKQAFVLDPEEVIYGLGQQQNGKLNQRGQKVYLRQENTKVAIPFIHSVKGYAIFWDNYSPTTFEDNARETSFDSEIGDCVDYYFMYGAGGDGVIAQMRELTGQAPMMPLWVFGFNQSRERYKTQFELLEVVRKYRELGVPLDGIVQDWQYWGKDSNWNGMNFDSNTFPDPKGMVDSVHKMNAHIFIVAWPGFGPETKQYAEFKNKDMLINFDTWPPNAGAKPYDVYNPEARSIYWDYLNKGIFSLGTDAWWLDSTEPDHINMKDGDFEQKTKLGSLRKVRNAFPLSHVSGVYDHQRKVSNAKRVVLLTRSAFAGQQRYGSNTWSGDVGSDWPTLKRQVPAALNFSLTGLPYWNADIGGFFAGSFNQGGGAKNPDFQELYVRWMQFSTFTPMMRSHGTDIPREIYQFGTRGESVFDIQEKFINLRYRLLPYNYATAWNVTNAAGSIMRPLQADFSKDSSVDTISNEYLYGKSFLVIPVTSKGNKNQSVYLPKGTAWFDFWTGETIQGGQTIIRDTPMDIIPLYVKAGTILPLAEKVQFASQKKWDKLELRIYTGANGEFTLYEDENDNYNYEKGIHSEIKFHWNDQSKVLNISARSGKFQGMLLNRTFNIILVSNENGIDLNDGGKYDRVTQYSGKALTVKFQ